MSKKKKGLSTRRRAIIAGYRSGLEERVASELTAAGVTYEYEMTKIAYVKPESKHKYTPDFVLSNGIIVETKGRFLADDRAKHLLIKAQHPSLDIRFVFSRSATSIGSGSKTTLADWCTKHGFLYADKTIPEEWLHES